MQGRQELTEAECYKLFEILEQMEGHTGQSIAVDNAPKFLRKCKEKSQDGSSTIDLEAAK